MAFHNRHPTGRQRPRPRPSGPWKNGPIPVIGIVGGIGSGKSTAASVFEESGAQVIDADKVGHALLDQRPVREQVVDRFGYKILAPPTDDAPVAIDRSVLGRLVFSDPQALRDLEAILHPVMRRTFERAIARAVRKGEAKAVVLDAAILYEAGWHRLCDRVVFVDASAERRLEFVAAGRGWTAETLTVREAAQSPLDDKRVRADIVLTNSGDLDAMRAEAGRVWDAAFADPPARPRPADDPPGPPARRGGPRPVRRARRTR